MSIVGQELAIIVPEKFLEAVSNELELSHERVN